MGEIYRDRPRETESKDVHKREAQLNIVSHRRVFFGAYYVLCEREGEIDWKPYGTVMLMHERTRTDTNTNFKYKIRATPKTDFFFDLDRTVTVLAHTGTTTTYFRRSFFSSGEHLNTVIHRFSLSAFFPLLVALLYLIS